MRPGLTLAALCSALVGWACSPPSPPPRPPAPATAASQPEATRSPVAPPPPGAVEGGAARLAAPIQLPVRSVLAAIDGQAPIPLDAEVEAEVLPQARFEVVLQGAWEDVRLALHDAADAMVPSTASREVGGLTRLVLTPSRPLTPAGHYRLRLSGAGAREPRDRDGAVASPAGWPLTVAGDPPLPPRRRTKRRR